ncbi:DUF6776 family protein [Isoalcanivorax beigongshangi]|uniref:DUF6776 family protein n=1 Tax=Isoalcanivorax beigongshangi TaxID=3238810 RepID=A0ABV4AK06_9GAMM
MKARKKVVRELTLMPVDVTRQRRQRWLWAVLGGLAVVLAFLVGVLVSGSEGWGSNLEQQRLRMQLAQMETNLREARDDLAVHRTSSEVSSQAQEQVRGELRGLRDQIVELEETVAFYKSIMAPENGEQGLQISRFHVAATEHDREYSFRLVLSQVGDNNNFIAGDVAMILEGVRGNQRVDIPAAQWLSEEHSSTAFRFRYFQELTGRVHLPEGVTPRAVRVEATASGRGGQRVERTFGWNRVEENTEHARSG